MKFYWLGANLIFALFFAGVINAQAATCPTDDGFGTGCSNPALPYYCNSACRSVTGSPSLAHCSDYVVNSCVQSGGCTNAATTDCGFTKTCVGGYSACTAWPNTTCKANVSVPANCKTFVQCSETCTACNDGYELSGGVCLGAAIRLDSSSVASDRLKNSINVSPSMSIFGSGNVAIGTTSALYRLFVAGNSAMFDYPVFVGAPTANDHAATKNYVDSAISLGGGAFWNGTSTGDIWNLNSGGIAVGTTTAAGEKLAITGGRLATIGAYNMYSGGQIFSAGTGANAFAGRLAVGQMGVASPTFYVNGGAGIGTTYSSYNIATGTLAVENSIGIGITNPGAKLDVFGDSFLNGSVGVGVAPSSTLRLIVRSTAANPDVPVALFQNSNGTNVISLSSSGHASFFNPINIGSTAYQTNFSVAANSNVAATSGVTGGVSVGNFIPPSGTATFSAYSFTSTINQSGGANGITRGVHINPTLTSAVDFRGVETNVAAGTGRWNFYAAGAASSYFNGSVGIGTTNTVYAKLNLAKDITSNGLNGFYQLILTGSTNPAQVMGLGYDTTSNFGYINAGIQGSSYSPIILNAGGGNVGIGTTTANAKLTVSGGNIFINDAAITSGTPKAAITKEYLDAALLTATSSLINLWGGTVGANIWNLNSGNIGIGTTTPNAKFQVHGGDMKFSSVTNGYLYFGQDAGGTYMEQVGNSASNENFRLQSSKNGGVTQYSQFVIDPTSGFAFTTIGTGNGNVGIGTAAPASKLDVVNGVIRQSGYTVADAATNNMAVNGDFEMNGWYGWTVGGSATTTGGYSGNYALQVTAGQTLLSDDYIPVDPTRDTLQLEAWVKKTVVGTTPGILYFGYMAYDANKTLITTAPCGTYCYFAASGYVIPVDSAWHKVAATTVGEGTSYPNFPVGTKYVRIMGLINYSGSADTVTQIDHISLRRINNGPLIAGGNYTGTNQTDQNQYSTIYTSAANNLILSTPGAGNVGISSTSPTTARLVVGASGTNYTFDGGNYRVGNIAAPVLPLDAVNKSYVDSAVASATSTNFWGGAMGSNVWALNSGNIGIGLTAPTQKLHVSGSIYTTNNLFMNTSGGSTGIGWYMPSYYTWFDYMKQGGAVSTPNGQAAPTDTASGVTGWARRFNTEAGGTYGWIFESGSNSTSSAPTVKFAINSGTGTFHSTGNALIDGSVGIGTTTPTTKLQLYSSGYGAATGLSFGDGDTGIYEGSDDIMYFGVNGASSAGFTATGMFAGAGSTGNAYLLKQVSSNILPVYSFVGDTTTGVGRAGSSVGSLIAGGVNVLNWNNSGNVGIGTTTPGTRLTVEGSGNYSIDATNFRIGNVAAPVQPLDAVNKSYMDSALSAATSSLAGLWGGTIGGNVWALNSGNVGIGTTNPTGKLDVSAGLASQTAGDLVVDTANNIVYVGKLDSVSNNTNFIFRDRLGNVKSRWENAGAGSISFGNFTASRGVSIANNALAAGASTAARLVVDSGSATFPSAIFTTGNVGVGTTNPTAKLDVAGSIKTYSGAHYKRFINVASYETSGAQKTGTLIIKVGTAGANTMAKIKISGWSYGKSWDIVVSGYMRPSYWGAIGDVVVTGNPPFNISDVRLTADSGTGNYYIFLGNTTTLFDYYTMISVDAEETYQDYVNTTGWTIDINATEPTITNTVTPSRSLFGTNSNISGELIVNGNVGVGTTTPGTRLTVVGSGNYSIDATNFRIGNVAAPVQPLDAVNKSYMDSALSAATSSLTGLWGGTTGGNIWSLNSGNVGIGTTSPSSLLNAVTGVSDFRFSTGASAVTPTMAVINSGAGGKAAALLAGTSGSAFAFDNSGTFSIMAESKSAFTGNSLGTGATLMRVLANGNVGINTTNPFTKLEISNQAAFNPVTPGPGYYGMHFNGQTTADYASGITWNGAGGNSAQAGLYVQGSGVYGTKMYFATTDDYGVGAKTRMMIDHVGDIGMGTTTPNAKLSVHGGNIFINDAAITSGTPKAAITKDYLDSALSTLGSGTSLWNLNGSTIYASSTSWMVGIGNTNPVAKMHLGSGTPSHAVAVERQLYVSSDAEFDGYTYFDGPVYFNASDLSIMPHLYFSEEGNELKYASDFNAVFTTNPNRHLNFDHAAPTTPTIYIQSALSPDVSNNEWVSFTHDANNFKIITGANTGVGSAPATVDNGIIFSPRGTEAMRIIGNGNVGISTSTPDAKLAVNNGNIFINDAAITSGTPKAAITKDYLDSALSSLGGGTSLWNINGSKVYASSTSWMVGVGTTNPMNLLQVRGALSGTGSVDVARFDGGSTVASGGLVFTSYYDAAAPSTRLAGIQSMDRDGNYKSLLLNLNGGNVGIGLNSPDAALHVVSGASDNRIVSFGYNATIPRFTVENSNYNARLRMWNSSALTYASQEQVLINTGGDSFFNGGNVGIGTTTPDAMLSVHGGNIFIDDAAITSGTPKAAITKDYLDSALSSLGGGTSLWNLNGSTIYASSTSWMVGIGTTTPDSMLNIAAATAGDGGTNNGSGSLLHLKQLSTWTGSQQWALFVEGYSYLNGFRINGMDTTRSLFQTRSTYPLGFATAGDQPITFTQSTNVERMRIAAGGNVGIGTTTPDAKLAVNGGNVFINDATITAGTPKAAITKDYLDSALSSLGSGTSLWNYNGSKIYASSTTWSVGIGTTDPLHPLEVKTAATGAYTPLAGFFAPANTTAGYASQIRFGQSDSIGNAAEWRFVYQGSNNALNRLDFGWDGYAAPAISYLVNGNVGIGTTSPVNTTGSGRVLHIADTVGYTQILAESKNTAGGAFFAQKNDSGKQLSYVTFGSANPNGALFGVTRPNNSFMYTYTGGALTLGTLGPDKLTLGTNSVGNMTIISGGYVGFGTSSPDTDKIVTVVGGNMILKDAIISAGSDAKLVITKGYLDSVIDALPSSGGMSTYATATPSAYNGSRGGYSSANALCNATLSGTHVCTSEEILNTINSGGSLPPSTTLWINSGPPGYTVNANDCIGWTNADSSSYSTIWVKLATGDGFGALEHCNNTRRYACCQ